MHVELLYAEGCRSLEQTTRLCEEVIAALAPNAYLEVINVSEDASALERYAGSPTVRVDGVDLEPDAPVKFWAG